MSTLPDPDSKASALIAFIQAIYATLPHCESQVVVRRLSSDAPCTVEGERSRRMADRLGGIAALLDLPAGTSLQVPVLGRRISRTEAPTRIIEAASACGIDGHSVLRRLPAVIIDAHVATTKSYPARSIARSLAPLEQMLIGSVNAEPAGPDAAARRYDPAVWSHGHGCPASWSEIRRYAFGECAAFAVALQELGGGAAMVELNRPRQGDDEPDATPLSLEDHTALSFGTIQPIHFWIVGAGGKDGLAADVFGQRTGPWAPAVISGAAPSGPIRAVTPAILRYFADPASIKHARTIIARDHKRYGL